MHWYLRVLLKYAVFEGRARRKEFWYFKLFHNLIIFSLILRGIYNALTKTYDHGDFFELVLTLLPPFFWFYLLVTFVPNLAVSVRRLHDINKGGENLLMWIAAPVGPLILFVFQAMPGTKGPNIFGPDPITHPNYVPPRKKRRQRTVQNRSRRAISESQRKLRQHTTQNRLRRSVPEYQRERHQPAQQKYQYRNDDQDSTQDLCNVNTFEGKSPTSSSPYATREQSSRRKRSALYGLNEPLSNEGEGYKDPFAMHQEEQIRVSPEQLKRFGLTDELPTPQQESGQRAE